MSGSEFICGTFPLVMSFRKQNQLISSSSDGELNNNYEFDSVFENETLGDAFVLFLTNNFEVEDYLFIKEVLGT